MTNDPQERLKRLLAQKGIRVGSGVSEPAPRRPGEAAPLSFAQERLWFLQRLEPESRAYHLGQSFRLRGPVDAAALGRAMDELLRRHEALRTGFSADAAGKARPEIAAPAAGTLRCLDLTARPGEAPAAEERLFTESFDLSRPPLFRALLVTLAPDEHRLAICVHHLVFDGWSIGLLARELAELYTAAVLRPSGGAGSARARLRRLRGPGSASAPPSRRGTRRSAGGKSACGACRPWSCRRTIRGPRGFPAGGRGTTSRWRARWPTGCAHWRSARGPRFSRCCWPAMRRCSAGSAPRRTSEWG